MRKPNFRITIVHLALLMFAAAILALLLACTVRHGPTPHAKYGAVITPTHSLRS